MQLNLYLKHERYEYDGAFAEGGIHMIHFSAVHCFLPQFYHC